MKKKSEKREKLVFLRGFRPPSTRWSPTPGARVCLESGEFLYVAGVSVLALIGKATEFRLVT